MRRRFCKPPRLHPPDTRLGVPPVRLLPAPDAAASDRRFLALHFPWLPSEVLPGEVLAGEGGEAPLILWQPVGPKRLVAAVNPAAAALGLEPGQPLADAQAMVPGLQVRPADPGAVAARLEALGLWALRITPLVALDPPDGLLLDLTGVTHLFGGEAAVLRGAVAGLGRLGHLAQAAVAGTAPVALALARLADATILPPGEEAAALSPMPLAALRLPEEVALGLRRLGLYRLGEVLAQPRAPLARRFGGELTRLLDAALGLVTPPFQAVRPLPDFHAARALPEPVVTRAGIDALAGILLHELCRQLADAGQGLRQLRLLAHRLDGGVQEIVQGTGLPSRDPRHLGRLLDGKLERLEPGFGFERMALQAEQTEPLAAAQNGLDGAVGADMLGQLLDRLAQRLPVWRLQPRASHWPEREVARVSPFTPVTSLPAGAGQGGAGRGWGARDRPVRLLRRPERIGVIALLPFSPPRRLQWRGHGHAIRHAEGPERFEAEWWRMRPDHPRRDYYRIELENGVRLWVCRAGANDWYLHGFLP